MMKTRLIRSLISCALIVCMLTGMLPVNVFSLIAGQATAHAEDFSAADGNWLYCIAEDGYAEILGYSDPNAESLTIPASVAQIAGDAFPGHEALTIRAANGTQALAFAAQRGFDVVNTSALDLFDDILDLSEMKSSQFAVVADMVTFSEPYAQQIAAGTKVFLPATGIIPTVCRSRCGASPPPARRWWWCLPSCPSPKQWRPALSRTCR